MTLFTHLTMLNLKGRDIQLVAAKTRGKLTKGETYTALFVRDDGKIAVVGRDVEDWYPMDCFQEAMPSLGEPDGAR